MISVMGEMCSSWSANVCCSKSSSWLNHEFVGLFALHETSVNDQMSHVLNPCVHVKQGASPYLVPGCKTFRTWLKCHTCHKGWSCRHDHTPIPL